MKIGIPVACQNGHASTWVLEIVGMEAIDRGATDACPCPKWNIGEGWRSTGAEPFVVPPAEQAQSPTQTEACLSTAEQKAQAERCGCRGTDDYCTCQNVADRITKAARAAPEPHT